MKNSTIPYLFGFFFLITCNRAFSTPSSSLAFADTSVCLEVDGKISNALEGVDATCLVELLNANAVVNWATLKEGKKAFRFLLKKNAVYTIRISKRGYITRLLCINTKISVEDEDEYRFSFETRLLKNSEAEKMDKEFLDFPIALVYYDEKKDCFIYDKEYTSRIKQRL